MNTKEAYESFLTSEYQNVASAHFNANTNITKFFEFYLIVVGLPITLFGIVFKLIERSGASGMNDIVVSEGGIFFGIVAFVVFVVGVCMFVYIVNLHMDSVLYARVVNGIRKYFTEDANLDFYTEQSTRALPRSIHTPKYVQNRSFAFVVVAFGIINATYCFCFGYVVSLNFFCEFINYRCDSHYSTWNWLAPALLALIAFAAHYPIYRWLAKYREHYYLRGNAVGIDVDGVLNKHRDQFCKVLKRETGVKIEPDWITKIPVHECEGLNSEFNSPVTRGHEQLVFNCPDYWTEMPAVEDASRALREFRDSLHLKVMIFTYRPWPNPIELEGALNDQLHLAGENAHSGLRERRDKWEKVKKYSGRMGYPTHRKWPHTWLNKFLEYRRSKAIKSLTKLWLVENQIPFDSFRIERGSLNVAHPRSKYRNRFNAAKEREIRFFVEDDPIKAKRMAAICEYVYLINHPYNQTESADALPRNVIRVDTLTEVVRHIRDYTS